MTTNQPSRPGSTAGARAIATRMEADSLGDVAVPNDRYWGAQTERSLRHFPIGRERYVWGRSLIESLGLVKGAAARANGELGELPDAIAALIARAAGEVASGALDDHFPLVVFQTGSGTQTNMNANEVIANRAIELAGGTLGSRDPVHPNDHVNRGQSSNDVFPSVMHIAATLEIRRHLVPAVEGLKATLDAKSAAYAHLPKVGRTHLQDATPITLGQEIGAWAAQLQAALETLGTAAAGLRPLALGGTAVGTGLNAHPRFAERAVAHLCALSGCEFLLATNRFAALSAHDAMVNVSAALRTLAGALMKIANDIRWLASGPRNGIGELRLPVNEPGSSIMPGKVNPTQCEALTQVAVQVYGNDACVAFAGSQGNFQLNVYKPVIAHNVIDSVRLLGDACAAFERYCAAGLEPDEARIRDNLARNLMLVTALNPHIGYDRSAEIARKAYAEDLTLREAALALGYVSAEDFDRWMDPLAMT